MIIYICIYVHTVVYSIYIQMCRLREVALQAPCNRCKHIFIESTHLPVSSRGVAKKTMLVCFQFVVGLRSTLLDRAWLHTCHPSARRGNRVGSGPCDWTMHSVLTLSFKSRCVGCAVAIGHRQSARTQGLLFPSSRLWILWAWLKHKKPQYFRWSTAQYVFYIYRMR